MTDTHKRSYCRACRAGVVQRIHNKFDYATDIFFDLGLLDLLFDLNTLFFLNQFVFLRFIFLVRFWFFSFSSGNGWKEREQAPFFFFGYSSHKASKSLFVLIAIATVAVNFVHSFVIGPVSEKKAGNCNANYASKINENKSTPGMFWISGFSSILFNFILSPATSITLWRLDRVNGVLNFQAKKIAIHIFLVYWIFMYYILNVWFANWILFNEIYANKMSIIDQFECRVLLFSKSVTVKMGLIFLKWKRRVRCKNEGKITRWIHINWIVWIYLWCYVINNDTSIELNYWFFLKKSHNHIRQLNGKVKWFVWVGLLPPPPIERSIDSFQFSHCF